MRSLQGRNFRLDWHRLMQFLRPDRKIIGVLFVCRFALKGVLRQFVSCLACSIALDHQLRQVKKLLASRAATREGLNNRAENSHVPLRKRERMMQGFRSSGSLQRFISIFSEFRNLFVPPRSKHSALATHTHRLTAGGMECRDQNAGLNSQPSTLCRRFQIT